MSAQADLGHAHRFSNLFELKLHRRFDSAVNLFNLKKTRVLMSLPSGLNLVEDRLANEKEVGQLFECFSVDRLFDLKGDFK